MIFAPRFCNAFVRFTRRWFRFFLPLMLFCLQEVAFPGVLDKDLRETFGKTGGDSIEALLVKARSNGLPVMMLENKIREGMAKVKSVKEICDAVIFRTLCLEYIKKEQSGTIPRNYSTMLLAREKELSRQLANKAQVTDTIIHASSHDAHPLMALSVNKAPGVRKAPIVEGERSMENQKGRIVDTSDVNPKTNQSISGGKGRNVFEGNRERRNDAMIEKMEKKAEKNELKMEKRAEKSDRGNK